MRSRPAARSSSTATALNRDHLAVQVKSIEIEGIAPATTKDKFGDVLPFNEPKVFTLTATVPEHQALSQPYWLVEPKQGDTYTVPNQLDVRPRGESSAVRTRTSICGSNREDVEIIRPVEYRYIERAQGELTRPVVVEPPVSLQWSKPAMLFPQAAAETAELQVRANIPKATGEVHIQAPAGWRASAGCGKVSSLPSAGEQSVLSFQLTPPSGDAQGVLACQRQSRRSNRLHRDGNHQLSAHSAPGSVSAGKRQIGARRCPAAGEDHRLCDGRGRRSAPSLAADWVPTSCSSAPTISRAGTSAVSTPSSPACAPTTSAPICAPINSACSNTCKNGGTLVVQYNVDRRRHPFGGDTSAAGESSARIPSPRAATA